MRKLFAKYLVFTFVVIPLFISCNDDEGEKDESKSEIVKKLDEGIMTGSLEEDYTLDAFVTYQLTGCFTVEDGAVLTIPAGTKIIAKAGGPEICIDVLMGGKININGTADAPVVITSENAQSGDWGGVFICGKATTTAGENAGTESGCNSSRLYGGTDDTDTSGVIRYLVVKYAGADLCGEGRNGITFYAVGSGTTVEGIAIIESYEDGIAFFGGTVSASKIYIENCEDDAIDWTEGWCGTITDTYVKHTTNGFSTVVEGDKVNANPKFVNLNAVSTQGGTALQFKKESGATITSLFLSGYDIELDMKDSGSIDNVIVGTNSADVSLVGTETHKYTFNSGNESSATVDISEWSWISTE